MSDKESPPLFPELATDIPDDKPLPILEPEVLEAVEKTVTTTVQTAIRREMKFHRGPLPTPEDFGKYDAMLPGAANRILEMAEREQAHRHAFEMEMANQGRTELLGELRMIRRGQWFAYSIVVASIGFAFLSIFLKIPVGLIISLLIAAVTVVGSGIIAPGKRSEEVQKPIDERGSEQ